MVTGLGLVLRLPLEFLGLIELLEAEAMEVKLFCDVNFNLGDSIGVLAAFGLVTVELVVEFVDCAIGTFLCVKNNNCNNNKKRTNKK